MDRRHQLGWMGAVGVAVALLLRLPYFLNPTYAFDSDHASVGLQALALLRGEWEWLLWGTSYQASFESLLSALTFQIFGPTPTALLWMSFTGYALILFFALSVLLRVAPKAESALLVVFLILASPAFLFTTLYPPRNWSLTATFLVLLALFTAPTRKRPHLWLGWGTAGIGVALYFDYFVIQFLIPLLWIAFTSWRQLSPPENRRRSGRAILLGGTAAVVWLCYLRWVGPPKGPPLAFAPTTILKNVHLFWNECLPLLLGYYGPKVDHFGHYPGVWVGARTLAGFSLVVAYFASAWILWRRPLPSPDAQRLGVFGCLTAAASATGFLGSSMASDINSVRYLAPIVWAAPFGLLPLVHFFGARKAGLLVLPYLISMGGLHLLSTHHLAPRGWPIRTAEGNGRDEWELREFLAREGLRMAEAPYWTNYRLTFLFVENPIVAPYGGGDRYRPYLDKALAERRIARVFPNKFREEDLEVERQFCLSQGEKCSEFRIRGYKGFIVERP